MHSCRPVNHPGSDKFQMSVLFLITDLLLSMTESVDTSAFPIPGYVITIILLFLLLCYPNPFPVWVCNNSYSEMTALPYFSLFRELKIRTKLVHPLVFTGVF